MSKFFQSVNFVTDGRQIWSMPDEQLMPWARRNQLSLSKKFKGRSELLSAAQGQVVSPRGDKQIDINFMNSNGTIVYRITLFRGTLEEWRSANRGG